MMPPVIFVRSGNVHISGRRIPSTADNAAKPMMFPSISSGTHNNQQGMAHRQPSGRSNQAKALPSSTTQSE